MIAARKEKTSKTTASVEFIIPPGCSVAVKEKQKIKAGEKLICASGAMGEFKSPLSGEINSLANDRINLIFPAIIIDGIWGGGEVGIGPLKIVNDETDTGLFAVKANFTEQVLAVRRSFSQGACYKADCLGVIGLIVGSFLGTDSVDLPLVAIGGEDGIIDEEIWKLLKKSEGETVVVDGRGKRILLPG